MSETTPDTPLAVKNSSDVHNSVNVSLSPRQTSSRRSVQGMVFFGPWNLFRLTQPETVYVKDDSSLNARNWRFLQDPNAGKGVKVYILDSGVDPHPDLSKLSDQGFNVVDQQHPRDTDDFSGSGTILAGLVAGTMTGVAKAATIVPIRVAGDDVAPSPRSIVAGINKAMEHSQTLPPWPRPVIYIGLAAAGAQSDEFDTAIAAATSLGIHLVMPAGDNGTNECATSPSGVIIVGAVDQNDARLDIRVGATELKSNYGSCVDVFAPGRVVAPDYLGGFVGASGTEPAAALAAGVVAQLSATSQLTPLEMKQKLKDLAVRAVDVNDGTNDKALMLQRPLT